MFQSAGVPRICETAAGMAEAGTLSLEGPASIMRMERDVFSPSRLASAHPDVPPLISLVLSNLGQCGG